MNPFDVKKFFTLDNYEHLKIFKNFKNVYEVISNIDSYLKSLSLGKIEVEIPKNVHLENIEQISIGKGTSVEPFSYIKGPCIIGKNSQIRHGAYIRGNVITGHNAIIGHSTEIKNSILLDNASLAHFAYVGDSIIGNNVNLGAGVKCANFRLDKKNISFFHLGKIYKTNLKKLGAIIGDNSQIGCNSVLNPATFLGKNVIIYSCLNIGNYITEDSIVKPGALPFVKTKGIKNVFDEIKK
ncbi:MAG: UDP-N-acetylglucosamine diphosphorylase [Parachlamydiales bacterium]|nr:UDP-N-acetylglucosamine diphosphorylase [Parachlamydiales bacterium]